MSRLGSKKIAILISVAVVFLVVIGISFLSQSFFVNENREISYGVLRITPSSIDYGDIVQEEGVVSRRVMITNAGNGPLAVNRISTSCGCTTATLDDMSDFLPGESRELVVTFDPMTHPDTLGAIVRVVYVQTSDPENPEGEIDVIGNVIRKEKSL